MKYAVRVLAALVFLLLATTAKGVTYYVRTDGSDTNTGTANTAGGAWLTIQKSADTMVAGDTARVQSGTYSQRVAITVGGTDGFSINYVADGQVVCRGFDVTGVSYVRLIGFEITHTNLAYYRAITLNGTCSHIDIFDNYIHDVYGGGVYGSGGTPAPTYITVRGNIMNYLGRVSGFVSNAAHVAIASAYVTPHHWLVEYNVVARSGDFVVAFGTNNIIRNNYLHDFDNSYWTNGSAIHSDMFQPGSDGAVVGTRHQVYERNFCGDSTAQDSHFGIWHDTVNAGDTNILIRGNVAFNFGSGGTAAVGTDKVSVYNNTFYKICQLVNGSVCFWYGSGTNNAVAGLCANTLIYDRGLSTDALDVQAGGNEATFTHNLGYLAGTESSYVSTSDPLFVNADSHDFTLQSGSPAINLGTNVAWVTSASASGTAFDVNDGQLFIDGWGIVEGDMITVSGNPSTRITAISGNTVTVSDSQIWTNGAPIFWGSDTSPDIGAFPYGCVKLTGATISAEGDTYTVAPTGNTRFVVFYQNGIPIATDATAPYTATVSGGNITAKAYAQYASDLPFVPASPALPAGSGTALIGNLLTR